MPILNMVGGGKKGGNIGEPLNLIVTTSGPDATITWEDNEIGTIPPTTFQKSELVRKIGSAPTSPSDGTLVVTETVKDTYKVSGYVDQGLTNGETYYYRVFSYSDLGGISYCDAVDVMINTSWQPGANTIAYYEFDNDLTDSSGNNRDLTLSKGTVTYGTASGGGKYAYFNTSTCTNNVGFPTINYDTDSYTVSFYWQPKSIFTSGAKAVFDWTVNGSDPRWLRVTESLSAWGVSQTYSATVDTWYYVVLVREGPYISYYINNTLIGSGDMTGIESGTHATVLRINAIGNASSKTNNSYLGKFIVEDKAWTQQERIAYYNQTKSLYGIS